MNYIIQQSVNFFFMNQEIISAMAILITVIVNA